MRKRILTSLVGAALSAIVLVCRIYVPIILDVCFGLVAAVAVWEVLNATRLIKWRVLTVVSMIYAVISIFAFSGYINVSVMTLNVLYAGIIIIIAVIFHDKLTVIEIAVSYALPQFITISLASLLMMVKMSGGYGVFLFLLAFNFAWSSDIGAYFAGNFFGKHKLAPKISPKKTVEGAIGGILLCTIVAVIMCVIFNYLSEFYTANMLLVALVSPLFSILGMFGDLFASLIKRFCGIKDYGNIMPGHGGILDRFDSLLLVSPIFYLFVSAVPIISAI